MLRVWWNIAHGWDARGNASWSAEAFPENVEDLHLNANEEDEYVYNGSNDDAWRMSLRMSLVMTKTENTTNRMNSRKLISNFFGFYIYFAIFLQVEAHWHRAHQARFSKLATWDWSRMDIDDVPNFRIWTVSIFNKINGCVYQGWLLLKTEFKHENQV